MVIASSAPRRFAVRAASQVNAAIDISDGLVGDLGHILNASGVGATLQLDRIPVSQSSEDCLAREQSLRAALFGGDDYELCFTVPEEKLGQLSPDHWLFSTCWPIGRMTDEPGLRIKTYAPQGRSEIHTLARSGYTHFNSAG